MSLGAFGASTASRRFFTRSNGHGDVVALTDATGTMVATYSYDTFGTPTIWEAFTTGWHNPYLYDGHDRARYDSETGLYWLSVRAYDPTLGRFVSRDPLVRAHQKVFAQPYVYAANNPVNAVDPTGLSYRFPIPKSPVDNHRLQGDLLIYSFQQHIHLT